MNELSALFRITAERQGIEGIEIARKLGLSQSMVSDILNGKKKNTLPPEILKGFGRVLGISQVQMMVALGYVDEDQGAERWDATLPPPIRDLLAAIDWSDPETVQGMTWMLERFTGTGKRRPSTGGREELRNRDVGDE